MTQPAHDILFAVNHLPSGQCGAVDQDDGHAKGARGCQLGSGTKAPGIFGDDMADLVLVHQRRITRHVKGATRQHDIGLRQRQGRRWRVNQPQQIVMLWLGGKGSQVLLADCQKHPRGLIGQGLHSRVNTGHAVPFIPRLRVPCRAFQRDQRDMHRSAGGNGILAYLGGKGVGGVYDMADPACIQIAHQAVNAPKSAYAGGQGLGYGRVGAPGIGKDGIHFRSGKAAGQSAGLGRAAQKQDARHV